MWVLLGLACAFLTGTGDALAKKLLDRSSEGVVGWAKLLFVLPWLALALALTAQPAVSARFWLLIGAMVPLEVAAYLFYLRAIRTAPMSLTVPFLAFTPLFTVFTGWLFLGERTTWAGLAGVASVTAGAYVLYLDRAADGILEPFRAMFRAPAVRLMLLTAGLYGVTSVLGKQAISWSGPTAFPFLYFSAVALTLTPIALREAASAPALARAVRMQWPMYLLAGGVTAAALLTHCFGIQRVGVAYFISIKRLSLLVSVLYGGFWFREDSILQRALGGVLMLAGAALILLSSGW